MMFPSSLNTFKETSGLWGDHPLFSLENLYKAYRQCRKRKRSTLNAILFEENLEENLICLRDSLQEGSYVPRRSLAFMAKKPKKREIFAADFRDRVVHHLLVSHLEPHWEKRFIHDSYACRKGKGTHRAVERLRSFIRKETKNGTRRVWYLQLDIKGYFVTLDRTILYELLMAHKPDPAVRWLIGVILFNEPTTNCRFRRTRREDLEALPAHRTLFKARSLCGLPIGNLTSQFFANVYLDLLDQFVKRTLKVRFYIRYCDDMVLLSQNKGELEGWKRRIKTFLERHLRLELNERNKLRPISDGVDFLGYIIRSDYLLVRRRVVGAVRERLKKAQHKLFQMGMREYPDGRALYPWNYPFIKKLHQTLCSYMGHFEKASSFRLLQSLKKEFIYLNEYFSWSGGGIDIRLPAPPYFPYFYLQKQWFLKHLPGHVVIIQRGRIWEVVIKKSMIKEKESEQTKGISPKSLFPHYVSHYRLGALRSLLLKGEYSTAWIGETGRYLGRIAERALIFRYHFETPKREKRL